MVLNPEQCHYMCLGKDSISELLRFCGKVHETSETETVLVIKIDNKLNSVAKPLKNYEHYKESQICQVRKKKSFVRFYKKLTGQLLPTCLDISQKKIKFSSEQCS